MWMRWEHTCRLSTAVTQPTMSEPLSACSPKSRLGMLNCRNGINPRVGARTCDGGDGGDWW